MNKEDIIEIIYLFSEKNLNKLIIKKGEFTLEVEKESKKSKLVNIDEQEIAEEDILPEKLKGYEIKSPLVGSYYESASPELEAFVKVGDYVEKDKVVCIIEAMKMINEIKSPVSGIIKEINFKNEDLVQYDDVIMEIEEDV